MKLNRDDEIVDGSFKEYPEKVSRMSGAVNEGVGPMTLLASFSVAGCCQKKRNSKATPIMMSMVLCFVFACLSMVLL